MIRTLVLKGGPDAEHDVSMMSAAEVAAALRKAPDIDVIEVEVATPSLDELRAHRPDVVFPVLHGPFGEGGPMQDLLEALGVAYVGCRPKAAARAMDKVLTKALASEIGVPTPASREVRPGESIDLDPPIVVKPANEGSSVGLSICQTAAEAEAAAARLHAMGKRVLAERYVRGREVTVGIIDGPNGTEVLPIIEIVPAVEFYDYEAKYHREDTRYLLEPVLPPGVAEALARFTRAVWERLGCRDLARADFLVEERAGQIGVWFLEINTMPGMTTHSLVPKAAAHRGLTMTDLCAGLVRRAFARQRSGPPEATGNLGGVATPDSPGDSKGPRAFGSMVTS
ncbi:MAG: D-alanine--D-alanine ligase [Phycisphaerae bacterium]|nr:D-alanine--D-alanine ligase [Phycisphaerae bacterium]